MILEEKKLKASDIALRKLVKMRNMNLSSLWIYYLKNKKSDFCMDSESCRRNEI